MTQFIARQIEPQIEQQLIDEDMHNVDKYFIMNQTLAFNNSKLSEEYFRGILVKIIYLVNQGIQFSLQEVEQLFFRITKLFLSNISRLRKMTYKAIKMIMTEKYVHILIEYLSKDLMSDNPQIKVQALKFIPFIQGEQYIQQIESFVQNSLIDTNLLVSSAALIVGIHIVNKFPNLVCKWLFEVVQNIDQQQENIEYHALILFHEIKKTNLSQFIKIIILLTQKQLKPLLNFQIINFIQDILPHAEKSQKKELITFLLQQVDSKVPLSAFQSSKILIYHFEVQNKELELVQQFIEEHLYKQIDNIEIYSSLKLMHFIAIYDSRVELITYQQFYLIKALSFNYRINIAQMGILFFIKLNIPNTEIYFKNLFNQSAKCMSQSNFLKGLREIIMEYPEQTILVLDFLKQAFSEDRENQLADIAIQLVEDILKVSKQCLKIAFPILIQITENPGLKTKYNAIKQINRILFNIQSTQLDDKKLILWFQYLKKLEPSQIDQDKLNFLRIQYNILENSCQLAQKRTSLDKKQINNSKII